MKYPTRALLRSLRRRTPGTGFWLPGLTAKEAWKLTEFLDEIQEAIWMDYGNAIADYLACPDCPDPAQKTVAGAAPPNVYTQGSIKF